MSLFLSLPASGGKRPTAPVGAGAARLLGASLPADGRYLLVSLGTGTSVLLVEGDTVLRVGGTALGGGTLMGLAAAILHEVDFHELCSLAEQGSRSHVDLMVSDIYDLGEIALPSDLTAASFAKLARGTNEPPARADLAAAIVGLVAENVALICNGLAVSSQARSIVFCGSTLRGNPALASVLTSLTQGIGHDAVMLPDGEFGGALGALELARRAHG